MDKIDDLYKTNKDLKQILKQYESEIFNDEIFLNQLMSLGISEEIIKRNIAALYRYRTQYYTVEQCRQKGSCVHEQPYHNLSLQLYGQDVELVPSLCPMRQKKAIHASRFLYRDCPPNYLDIKFSDVTPRAAQKDYLRVLLSLMNGSSDNIYVSGPNGSGKKYLALASLNKILEKDSSFNVAVVNLPRFIRENSADYFARKQEIDSNIRDLISVSYLVLDDFGSEETNKLIRDVIIYPLLSERRRLGKPTIMLSQISLDELSQLYDVTRKEVRAKQIIATITSSIKTEVFINGIKL